MYNITLISTIHSENEKFIVTNRNLPLTTAIIDCGYGAKTVSRTYI